MKGKQQELTQRQPDTIRRIPRVGGADGVVDGVSHVSKDGARPVGDVAGERGEDGGRDVGGDGEGGDFWGGVTRGEVAAVRDFEGGEESGAGGAGVDGEGDVS